MRVPFSGSYKRGDRLRFKVETEIYHKLILGNSSSTPAKIVRFQFRDGKALAENEQGPLDFRTNRLFEGESKTHTLAWKLGMEIILEIHEGEMQVEVKPER